MNANLKHQNVKKVCLSVNTWLIIAAIVSLNCVTSCVPPINGTTGQRVGKKEVQLANTSYSKSKKYKNGGKNNKEAEESNDANYSANTQKIPDGAEYNDIIEFGKQLNNPNKNANPDESAQSKSMPSLKEQLEELEQQQKDQAENIDNMKGDLLEIKTMLSDIASDRIKPANAAGHAMQPVNNQATTSKETEKHSVIESEEANPKAIDATIESDENQGEKTGKPEVAPKKTEEPPVIKQNKNFKIVKAATQKPDAKANTTPAKEKPKPVQQAAPAQQTVAKANESKSTSNDFSGIIATIAKKDFSAATKQIQEKMKSTSNADIIANCNYWLGECSFNQRDYAKSIEYYKQALNKQCDKKDVAQVRIAEAYLRVGKNSEAKVAYQTLLKEYPKSSHTPKAKKMLQQL